MNKIITDIMGEKILILENTETGKISNINLTLMFGKGKEPKTVEEFNSMVNIDFSTKSNSIDR